MKVGRPFFWYTSLNLLSLQKFAKTNYFSKVFWLFVALLGFNRVLSTEADLWSRCISHLAKEDLAPQFL